MSRSENGMRQVRAEAHLVPDAFLEDVQEIVGIPILSDDPTGTPQSVLFQSQTVSRAEFLQLSIDLTEVARVLFKQILVWTPRHSRTPLHTTEEGAVSFQSAETSAEVARLAEGLRSRGSVPFPTTIVFHLAHGIRCTGSIGLGESPGGPCHCIARQRQIVVSCYRVGNKGFFDRFVDEIRS